MSSKLFDDTILTTDLFYSVEYGIMITNDA
jgi:hypothetical protein